jgi:Kinesin motor domain
VTDCTQVISALAESSTVARSGSEPPLHIPYRDSKLTKLLMDSLVMPYCCRCQQPFANKTSP